MDIKNLKGTVSVPEFADGLLYQKKFETFGALWEDYVGCAHCIYAEKCEAICAHYKSKGIELYCGEVIDYLLGDCDLEEVYKEAN